MDQAVCGELILNVNSLLINAVNLHFIPSFPFLCSFAKKNPIRKGCFQIKMQVW